MMYLLLGCIFTFASGIIYFYPSGKIIKFVEKMNGNNLCKSSIAALMGIPFYFTNTVFIYVGYYYFSKSGMSISLSAITVTFLMSASILVANQLIFKDKITKRHITGGCLLFIGALIYGYR